MENYSHPRLQADNATDRIVILEDTDHDGVVDSRKVFLEGIPFPSAIAIGHDGLFLGAPPNLLFVPDKDGDDKEHENSITHQKDEAAPEP